MRKRLLVEEESPGGVEVAEVVQQNPRDMQRRKFFTKRKQQQKSFTRFNVEYSIKDNCIENMPINKWIGNGKYGSVFLVCLEHQCEYVLKMIPLNVYIPTEDCDISLTEEEMKDVCLKYSDDDFIRETEMSIMFGDVNIGPKVKVFGICNEVENKYQGKIRVGYIVQEKYDLTLHEFIASDPIGFINSFLFIQHLLIKKAKMIDEMGYFNEDVHQENIMLKINDGEIKDVVFIDFGIVGKYLETDKERNNTEHFVIEFMTKLYLETQRKIGKIRKNKDRSGESSEEGSGESSDEDDTRRSLFTDDEKINVRKGNLFGEDETKIGESESTKKRQFKRSENEDYHGEPVSWNTPDRTKGYMPRHPIEDVDVLLKRKHEKELNERDLRKKKKKNKSKKTESVSNIGSLYEQMEQMKIDEENPDPRFGFRQVFYG